MVTIKNVCKKDVLVLNFSSKILTQNWGDYPLGIWYLSISKNVLFFLELR